jgi:hypothetical protein
MEDQLGYIAKSLEQIKISTSDVSSQGSSTRPRRLRQRLLELEGRQCCILTGESDVTQLTLAHIIPYSELYLMPRTATYRKKNNYTQAHKSSENMAFLRSDLEKSYDDYKWSFDSEGHIHVFYSDFKNLEVFKGQISLPAVEPLHPEVINARHKIAVERSAMRCSMCWKLVGKSNIDSHRRGSCPHPEEVKTACFSES